MINYSQKIHSTQRKNTKGQVYSYAQQESTDMESNSIWVFWTRICLHEIIYSWTTRKQARKPKVKCQNIFSVYLHCIETFRQPCRSFLTLCSRLIICPILVLLPRIVLLRPLIFHPYFSQKECLLNPDNFRRISEACLFPYQFACNKAHRYNPTKYNIGLWYSKYANLVEEDSFLLGSLQWAVEIVL